VKEDLAISIDKVEKHHKNGKHLHDKKLHLDKKHQASQKPHKGASPPQGA
jgi:hypothetical protein